MARSEEEGRWRDAAVFYHQIALDLYESGKRTLEHMDTWMEAYLELRKKLEERVRK